MTAVMLTSVIAQSAAAWWLSLAVSVIAVATWFTSMTSEQRKRAVVMVGVGVVLAVVYTQTTSAAYIRCDWPFCLWW